jgi:chitodextrinase
VKHYLKLFLLVVVAMLAIGGTAEAAQYKGLWVTDSELAALSPSGLSTAPCTPNLGNQDNQCDVTTMETALAGAKTGNATLLAQARDQVIAAIGTQTGCDNSGLQCNRALALGRSLNGFILAADIANMPSDSRNSQWVTFLTNIRTQATLGVGANSDGPTSLIACAEDRLNNWGTWCRFSLAAANLYLGDNTSTGLADPGTPLDIKLLKGYLGDHTGTGYNGFKAARFDWQPTGVTTDTQAYGINPVGATKSGCNVDGAVPDDQSRPSGGTPCAPGHEDYAWDALGQGTAAEAYLFGHNTSTNVWEDQSSAIKRGVLWQFNVNNFPPAGDDCSGLTIARAAYSLSSTTYPCASGGSLQSKGYSVKALGNPRLGGGGTPPPDTTAPSNVGGLTNSVTQTSVTWTWNAATDNVGVDHYEVVVDGGTPTNQTTLSKAVTGLACGTSHSITVKAVDAAGNKSVTAAANTVSTSTCSTPDTTPPSNVTGLSGSTTQTSATWSWSAATDNVGVTSYEVVVDGGTATSQTSLSKVVSGLTCNTSHTITVKAVDAAGNKSATAATSTVTTAACTVPDTTAPSNVTGLTSSSTQTSATWNWSAATDNVGVTGYEVVVDGGAATTQTGTSKVVSGLTCNTSHSISVKAVDAAGNKSATAATNTVVTAACTAGDTTPPSGIPTLSATKTATSITYTWGHATDNVGVTGYRIAYNVFDGSTYDVQIAKTGTTDQVFTRSGLTCNTTYNIGIMAIDAAGNVGVETTYSPVTTDACSGGSARTLVTTADTYTDDAAPTTNYGSAVTLWLDGSPIRRAWFKFAIPADCTSPTNAKLSLSVNAGTSTSVNDVKVASSSTWTETGLTHATAPSVGSSVATWTLPAGYTITNGNGPYVDSTVIPAANIVAGQNLTLVVDRAATSRIDVINRTDVSNMPPVLKVTC